MIPLRSERRCTDCGAQLEASADFCSDCWGESLIWAEGDDLADLKQWAAFVEERRMHANGGWGEEPTVICAGCGRRIEAAEAWHSLDGGKPMCRRCHQLEQE